MSAASPHRPPPPKPLLDLHVTVISAKHLKNVNWRNGDLKPYAVAYLHPDRRSATKPDDSGSTRPVWNERLTLPLPLPFNSDDAYSKILTLDVFHSKPSETPKPLVGTARVPFKDLDADLHEFSSAAGHAPIITLELRRPSVRIKVALRERPLPPPEKNDQMPIFPPGYCYSAPPPAAPMSQPRPPPEQDYQIPPFRPGYCYSTAPPPAAPMPPPPPPPQARDGRTFSQSPPVAHYSSAVPPRPSQYHYSGSEDPASYDPYYYYYYYSSNAAYYWPPPLPAPAPARPAYYDCPGLANYGRPSAPVDFSPSYEQKMKVGMGAGLAVGAVAGALGGLALEEGVKYEEEKIVQSMAARDDCSANS